MKASKKKKALFAAIAVVTALFFLEVITSWALMLRMRIANTHSFTKSEPTYFSLINIPYKAGVIFGLFDQPYHLDADRAVFEPDADLGYKPLLSETLHMGTCLRGAAQVGLYPGDTSQGAGTIIGEDATYTRIASIENALRQKAQNLFRRDLRFGLSDAVLFFRFVPGRSVPYFDGTTIGAANSLLAAQSVGNEQVVVSMGRDIGTASKLARWYAILPNLVQMVARQDPQRAYFLQPGVQQSQQCIVALYPDVARQVQSDFSAFGCNIAVPQLDTDIQSRAWRAVVDATRNCIQTKV